ncbi:MAG: XDD4 family exosortase-dependent surface protein [Phycisphaerales bacterium]
MSAAVLVRACGALAVALSACSAASAAMLDTSATTGSLSASATFVASGSNLIITLTNTSTADANVPADMLTAVFFDIAGPALSLTRVGAVLAPGSTVINSAVQPAGGVVGGEWAYVGGLVGAPHGASHGISSAGFGLFGPGELFPGPNLDGPLSPNGVQHGITSASDPGANNNGGASVPLIRNAVVFTLGGLPSGFDPSTRITNVSFQYGTGLDEPNLLVPAPGAAGLFGLGLLAIGRRRR